MSEFSPCRRSRSSWPRRPCIEIGHHLRVGTFETTLPMISWMFGNLRLSPCRANSFRRDGEIACLVEATAHVLIRFVNAEYFLDDQKPGFLPSFRRARLVGWHLTAKRRNFHFADFQPLGVSRDRSRR